MEHSQGRSFSGFSEKDAPACHKVVCLTSTGSRGSGTISEDLVTLKLSFAALRELPSLAACMAYARSLCSATAICRARGSASAPAPLGHKAPRFHARPSHGCSPVCLLLATSRRMLADPDPNPNPAGPVHAMRDHRSPSGL